ncbi:MAG TPA: FIST N-terminal domain-containing protein [Ktedonobacteraceae bacterium]|jgi:small ligand-binding sensory domain FIST
MEEHNSIAKSAIIEDEQWDTALQRALAQVGDISADLVFLFASDIYTDHFPEIVRRVRSATGARILIGCSGQGIVGRGLELEDVPAISLLALSLPDASLQAIRFTPEMITSCADAQELHTRFGLQPDDVNAFLIFADPFQTDSEQLIELLACAYPTAPVLGGLASGDFEERCTYIFCNDEIYENGAVGLAIGGEYTIFPLLSQGCEPIGEPWTITKVRNKNLITTISNRPAFALLVDTLEDLSPELQRRARRNLLVGLAADEYSPTLERGSFLIRQLIGIDRHTGALAIGAMPRQGQTIQFQMRDAMTADLDLRELLILAKVELAGRQPVAAVLCTCNGRGLNMFGEPHHDARLIAQEFGALPVAGLFCSGEIGPVGKRSFLHGFTASLALIVKRNFVGIF